MVCSCSTVPGGFEQWYVLNIPASKPQKRHGAPGAGWQSEEAQGWEQSSLPLVIHCDIRGTTKKLFPSISSRSMFPSNAREAVPTRWAGPQQELAAGLRSLPLSRKARSWLPPQPEATSQHPRFFVSPHVSCYRTADRAARLQECCGQPGEKLQLSAGEVQETAEHGAEANSRSLVLLVGGLTGLLLLLLEVAAAPSAVLRSRAIGFPPCTCKSHSSCVQASKSDISREQVPSWSQYIN